MADPQSHYPGNTGAFHQGAPQNQPVRNPVRNVMPGVPGTGYQQQMAPKHPGMPTPNSYPPRPPGPANAMPNVNFGAHQQPPQAFAANAPAVVGAANPGQPKFGNAPIGGNPGQSPFSNAPIAGQPPFSNAPMSFTGPSGVAPSPRNMPQQSPSQAPPGSRMMMAPHGGQIGTPLVVGQQGMASMGAPVKSQSSPLPPSQPWQQAPPGGVRMSSPPPINGTLAPQTHTSQPPVRGTAPPMVNGPAQVPPMSRMQGPPPPRIGENYQKPVSMPPTSQHFQASAARGQPPQQMQLPPRIQQPGTIPGTAPGGTPPLGRPTELPVPYHGSAQYSHQLHENSATPTGLTPNASASPSQKSSRAPSPIPGPTYDAMEGQFSPSQPAAGYPQGTPQRQPMQQQMPSQQLRPTQQRQLPPQMHQQPPQHHGMLPQQRGMPPGLSQQPGFPPQRPGMAPQQPGFPPQQPRLPQQPGMPQQPGFPSQQPEFTQQQPGMAPQQPGFPPPQPGFTQQQQPGFMQQQQQQPGLPPQPQPQQSGLPGLPPAISADQARPSITGRRQYPGMAAPPPQPSGPPGPQMGSGFGTGMPQHQQQQQPAPGGVMANNVQSGGQPNALNSNFATLGLQSDANRTLNLLQDRHILPAGGVTAPAPNLPRDLKKLNCSTDVFRCTLTSIPNSQSLLTKSRLPFGILIHPFKDLSQLPVIQSSVIVRCRSCRTYINPFVSFVDSHRWKCNLCYRVNDLPEEFNYDPVTKSYGEPHRRPEVRSGTIEFIAPSEYMLRPPQPAVYLYVLDVSFNAIETGYLSVFCQSLSEELDRIPGDLRTQIGFITFDRSLHFYSLDEDHSQPQMLVVSDVDEIFLPTPDSLLVNLNENRQLVADLLKQLPTMFEKNMETGSALGPALQAAYKLMSGTGGRIQVVQSQLPTVGPGALQCREDPNERAGKKIQHLGPATDFYKKLALDCSAQQIAVDLFFINAQYADVATIACVSKYSGGCIHYFPSLHTLSNVAESERFESCIRRYISRKIGFESVMRIRCTRGLSIHTFHGNFFVRSTDLLSLPNINPDAGFGMQLSIEDTVESNFACFQAALLYTSSKGERRIRVHNLCVPVTSQISEVFLGADQEAIIGLLSKMGVDRCLSASTNDAREAFINAAIDILNAFGSTIPAAQRIGQLLCPVQLRLIPVYILALLKSMAFRVGASTKLDERVITLEELKTLPLAHLLMRVYPHLYPVHMLDEKNGVSKGDVVVPQPPRLQLSSANIDRHGAYLMDTGAHMYLWLGAAVSDKFCEEVFEQPNFKSIQDNMVGVPELENPTSELLLNFINHLNEQRPFPAPVSIIREDSRMRHVFIERLVEDRSESTFSYYEFLQHLQKEMKS